MAAENLAEVVNPLQPEVKVAPQKRQQIVEEPSIQTRHRLSTGEKLLYTVSCCIALVSLVFLVSLQVTISNQSRNLQDVNTKIASTQTKNDDYQQTINELTKSDRLKAIAQKNGLSMIDGNIRNVTK